MYWFFAMICLLLLAFQLEPVLGRPSHHHYVLIWTWNTFKLLHILPVDVYVLVDGKACYQYLNTLSTETYIPTVHLSTRKQFDMLHYRYLLDWIQDPPIVQAYSPSLSGVVPILNEVRQAFL